MKPLHYSYRAAVSPLLSWGDYDYDSMALRSAWLLGLSSHLSVFGNWLSWGPFFMLFPGNLGIVSCLSGLFGSSGYIYYAGLGRMKCNGLQIRFGTMVPVKPLGSSRPRKGEFSTPDLLPQAVAKTHVSTSNASWKWVSSFTPSNGIPLPVSLTGLHPKQTGHTLQSPSSM